MSIPNMKICMAWLLPIQENGIILNVLGRAGHPIGKAGASYQSEK